MKGMGFVVGWFAVGEGIQLGIWVFPMLAI